MNMADRSLAMVYYALRRRFVFYTLEPAFNKTQFAQFLESKSVPPVLIKTITKCFINLNKDICRDIDLGSGFQIGHSYFCPDESQENWQRWYNFIIEYQIKPLLEEYWFDNIECANKNYEKLRISIINSDDITQGEEDFSGLIEDDIDGTEE